MRLHDVRATASGDSATSVNVTHVARPRPHRLGRTPVADAIVVGMRVEVVCTGNICRSPMGEVVLQARLGPDVEVGSSGTGSWHLGYPMDPRAAQALRDRGYAADGRAATARRFDPAWFADRDLILAMDAGHLAELRELAGEHGFVLDDGGGGDDGDGAGISGTDGGVGGADDAGTGAADDRRAAVTDGDAEHPARHVRIAMFDPESDVADPYYGDQPEFDAALRQIEAAADRWVEQLS